MFDFKKLKLVKNTVNEPVFSSFVGIRKNKVGVLEFNLPRGFDNFPENDFLSVKNLFFKMYQTFQKFQKNHAKNLDDTKPAAKDSIEVSSHAYRFKDSEDNDVILYSKIKLIENMLEAYKELSLDTISSYAGRNEQIEYSKIECYLDKAVYLENDIIYIDEMNLDRKVLNYKKNDLIGLFCFILNEIECELNNEVNIRVIELSNQFVDNYLSPDQKLFDEYYFQSTINILKDVLYSIDKETAYKDAQYWVLFEAVERFLYGELDMESTQEDGTFWGVSNFYQIWEDMCNMYMIQNTKGREDDLKIIYADTNIFVDGARFANSLFGGCHIFLDKEWSNPFFIDFRGQRRWIRPDMLIKNYKHNIIGAVDQCLKIVKKNRSKNSFDIEITVKEGGGDNYFKMYNSFCTALNKNMKGGRRTVINRKKSYFSAYHPIDAYDRVYNQYNINPSRNKNEFFIIDWKYLDAHFFEKKSEKLDVSITKQLCYESCFYDEQPNEDFVLKSQFGIPWYDQLESDNSFDSINYAENKIYSRVVESGIEIVKINFLLVQAEYIKNA